MTDLVYLKNDDIFTDSMVIAKATDNQHESIVRLISKHRAEIEKFGRIGFSDLKSGNLKGGRPTRIYQLTEPQATLLITFLDNSDKVVAFKVELVRQFFEMRKFIAERSTPTWIEARAEGKVIRRLETGTIKRLTDYAKEQGSTGTDKAFYINYSNMADKAAGVAPKCRDKATAMQLLYIAMYENIINNTIRAGMEAGDYYKDIYKSTKTRIGAVQQMAYIA